MTSTGETKVIERFDCSGCGDVDTSTVIKKVVDGCITGLTGRKLKVNSLMRVNSAHLCLFTHQIKLTGLCVPTHIV